MTTGITTIWLNDWKDYDQRQLESSFGLAENELSDINVMLASYKDSGDAGYAFILFSLGQSLFEVNASHDSELNLKGQWQPEETSIEALMFRLEKGNLGTDEAGDNIFAESLKSLLLRL